MLARRTRRLVYTAAAAAALLGGAALSLDAEAAVTRYSATRAQCARKCPLSDCKGFFGDFFARAPTALEGLACLDEALESVSKDVADEIRGFMTLRLDNPMHGGVFLFVGDNGVGKTRLAHAMSRSISKCPTTRDEGQLYGDALLELDSTGFSGLTPGETRRVWAKMLTDHARLHPTGMISISDVLEIGPNVADILAPLVTGSAFPEYPDVPLRAITVVMTMDTNRTGATRPSSVADVRSATRERLDRMDGSLGSLLAARAMIVPFLAFDDAAHRRAIHAALRQLPCVSPHIASVTFTPRVVDALLEQLGANHSANGRGSQTLVHDLQVHLVAHARSANRAALAQAAGAAEEIVPMCFSLGASSGDNKVTVQQC